MSRLSRSIRPTRTPGPVLAAVALGLAALATACTPAPSGPSTSPSAAASSAPASSAPASSAPASPSASATAAGLTIDITIADGKVTPNAEKIDVAKGTTVTLKVTSDQDDEIHAHTAGDGYELEVTAGKPATGSFVAADTGSFEIESHHLNKVIAVLDVR